MVWHDVPLDNPALLRLCQGMKNGPQMTTGSPKQDFTPPFGNENDVLLAVPFRVRQALINFGHNILLKCLMVAHQATEDVLPQRSNLFKSHWSNQWLTL